MIKKALYVTKGGKMEKEGPKTDNTQISFKMQTITAVQRAFSILKSLNLLTGHFFRMTGSKKMTIKVSTFRTSLMFESNNKQKYASAVFSARPIILALDKI